MNIDLDNTMSQQAIADLIGATRQAVSEIEARGIARRADPLGEWLRAYCIHMREMAAGRATTGNLDLATERARLAAEQADRIAMQNAVSRRELAPVPLIAEILSRVGRQVATILEAIPIQLKRRSSIGVADLEFITAEIVRARNLAAAIELDLSDLADADAAADAQPVDQLPDDPTAA
jgi:phage terminase Nu1 subunit (DNA packaging protein)